MNIKSNYQLQKTPLRQAHQRASSICHIQKIDFGQESCFSIPRTNMIELRRDYNQKKYSKSFINFKSAQKQKSLIQRHKTNCESLKISNELLQYILGQAKQNHKILQKQKGQKQNTCISKQMRKSLFQNEFRQTMYNSFIIEKKKMTLNKNTLTAMPFQNKKLNFLNRERIKTANISNQHDYKNQVKRMVNQESFQSFSPFSGKRISTLPIETSENHDEQNNQETYLTSHNLVESKRHKKILFLEMKKDSKSKVMKKYETIDPQRFYFKKSLCSRDHSRTTNTIVSSLSKEHSTANSKCKREQQQLHQSRDHLRSTFTNINDIKDMFSTQNKQISIHHKQVFLKSRKLNSKKKYTATRRQSLRQCQEPIKEKFFCNLMLNGRKIEGKV